MRPCPQCATLVDDEHKFCPSCGFPIGKLAVNTEDPLVGRTLPGGYVILELVGIGGMGRVYRAEQTNLGRTVAIKIIHPHLVGEENAAARFITEARAASCLNHPNSVSVIDFGKTADGQLYLVMEYLRGRDLARVAYDEGPLPLRRVVNVLRQVLAALSEAHHLGIIHRDLKPENIILEPMRTGGDFVKVVDFGLAKMREASASPSITSPGIVCGTPEYMSPEQGRGDPIDSRSDLYAVGVIFYQLLTGRLPFEGDSPTQVVLMHIGSIPPDPQEVAPERKIPQSLIDVLFLAMAKDPEHRFTDADEFAEALADGLDRAEGGVGISGGPRSQASFQKCVACGAMNPSSQKFCGECGASLHTSAPAPGMRSGPNGGSGPPVSVVRGGDLVFDPLSGRNASKKAPARERDDLPRFPLPFIGREADLAWLEDQRDDAARTLRTACLVGEVGVGKSRLLREFLALCASAGDRVVVTGPDPAWAEVGYYALRTAIEGLAALPADLDASGPSNHEWPGASPLARRGLLEIFGPPSDDVAGNAGNAFPPEERRRAAAEALAWAFGRAREQKARVALAVDDFHHIDGASRNAFVDMLAHARAGAAKALVVLSYPSDFVVSFRAPGASKGHAETPGFEGQESGDAGGHVVRIRAIEGLALPLVEKLLTATAAALHLPGGRTVPPLHLEQLLRFAREQGDGAPSRLVDLMAARLERLAADARRVLQAIAVYGDGTHEGKLPELVPEETSIGTALALLVRTGMIERAPRAGGDTLSVSHPLLREVVLATIPAAVRRELHQRAADVCEAASAPLEVLAHHEQHAQNTFRALVLLERVSVRCVTRGDVHGSIEALRRGLDLARRELFRGEMDDPMRAVLIFSRKLGDALARAGDFTDAEGVLREALDVAGPSGQDRARVLGTLAHVARGRDRFEEAHTYLREAMLLATQAGSDELMLSLEDLQRSLAS